MVSAPLCWRDRLQMNAEEGWAEQVPVPSPQMAPCLPPAINRRWLPAVITVFKQLGPAWSNSWLPGHWEHKLWALLALGYQLKPAWSKTGWVSSLPWFWEAGCAGGLRAVSSSLSRRTRLSCLLCCLLQWKVPLQQPVCTVSLWSSLPKVQPVQTVALMQHVCLTSGLINNYTNLGASSFRPGLFLHPQKAKHKIPSA